jgi:hypothetical protein
MRRLFWLALGASLGVLIMRKLSQMAARLTPRGVAESLSDGLRDLAEAIGAFGHDVRAAMAERESELREATGLDSAAAEPSAPSAPAAPSAP